ncbi:Protein OS-9 [Arachnomyces sp. PD_36]|nr:Protein OS-9 [Arachnomyces sp. PD_36]
MKRGALCLAYATAALASRKVFSIHDDILAFPQFEVTFPEEYILEDDVQSRVQRSAVLSSARAEASTSADRDALDRALSQPGRDDGDTQGHDGKGGSHPEIYEYEEMILDGRRYLCDIPRVDLDSSLQNETTEAEGEAAEAEHKKELARATDRGLELLRDMEGKCLYFISGYWSYSFCYNNKVEQFHALPPGNGRPMYPPTPDPMSYSFVLGRFNGHGVAAEEDIEDEHPSSNKKPTTDVAELETKGESRYLVQHLEGGTTCDLTGRPRSIEVQFHCHPQSGDRIGRIKELRTCTYLMVIYTPRLCDDVAFLPPREDKVHGISCREILTPEEVPEWEDMISYQIEQTLLDSIPDPFPIVGDIEVGATKWVGGEGRRIEKGKVASAGEEETIDVVAKNQGGRIELLSNSELKQYGLDPQKIESLKEKLEEIAKGKDWTLEVIETDGERSLRGIVGSDDDESEEYEAQGAKLEDSHGGESPEKNKQEQRPKKDDNSEKKPDDREQQEKGSEETFKDEL